jgi:hypothetical protein
MLAPSTLAQWVGGIATSAAVFVALFREVFIRCIWHPRFALRIDRAKSPIEVTAPGNLRWSGDAYFLRLWVENTGNQRAEDVQVFVSDVLMQQPNKSFTPVPGFLPMNLRWSHSDFAKPEIYADGISAEMGKHCDLAAISDPSNPTLAPLPGLPKGQVSLDLALEVFPFTQSHRLVPGTYELHLKVAAGNRKPVLHRVKVTFSGQWFTKETNMFSSRGVDVELLK